MSHSLSVHEAATTGDRETDIAAALQRLAATHAAVIVTGGLGPTEDDRTARAAATAFATPLGLNDTALKQIRERFRSMQRHMHPANEKQAMLPGRSRVIANRMGTAPGFHLQHLGTEFFFLPGVPREIPLDDRCLEVWTKLVGILGGTLGVDADRINYNTRLVRDLAMN